MHNSWATYGFQCLVWTELNIISTCPSLVCYLQWVFYTGQVKGLRYKDICFISYKKNIIWFVNGKIWKFYIFIFTAQNSLCYKKAFQNFNYTENTNFLEKFNSRSIKISNESDWTMAADRQNPNQQINELFSPSVLSVRIAEPCSSRDRQIKFAAAWFARLSKMCVRAFGARTGDK